jgi:hypothetical protein
LFLSGWRRTESSFIHFHPEIRTMKKILYLIIAIVSSESFVFAQQASFQDVLLDQLAGKWVLHGTIAGKETTHDIDAQWVLAHQYMRFHEISREKDTTGAAAYEAIVFIGWDKRLQQYACLWLDVTSGDGLSNGVIGHAKRNADRIAFSFKGRDGNLFRTVFIRDRIADRWQWLMDGEENGKLQPFARVTLTRK